METHHLFYFKFVCSHCMHKVVTISAMKYEQNRNKIRVSIVYQFAK